MSHLKNPGTEPAGPSEPDLIAGHLDPHLLKRLTAPCRFNGLIELCQADICEYNSLTRIDKFAKAAGNNDNFF